MISWRPSKIHDLWFSVIEAPFVYLQLNRKHKLYNGALWWRVLDKA